MQPGHTQPSPPALVGLPGPVRTLRHTSRRLRRVGLFSLDVVTRVRTRRFTSPAEAAAELSWVSENLAALHGLHFRVRGKLPAPGSLLVANHISYLDPVAICSLVPSLPVAKHEVRSWPAVGDVGQRLGVLYFQRGSVLSGAQILRRTLRLLQQGVSVLVFPEGTTTHGRSVLPMLRGSFGIAARVGAPIVPVGLSYDHADVPWVGSATFVSHYVRNAVRPCTEVSIDFRPPLHGGAGVTAQQLAERARQSILEGLATQAAAGDLRYPTAGAC